MRIKTIGISEREAIRQSRYCEMRPVSGSGVTSQKINPVQYYVEARSTLRRRVVREGGRDEWRNVEYSVGVTSRGVAPCNFRTILWEFKNNSIRSRGSLSEIC